MNGFSRGRRSSSKQARRRAGSQQGQALLEFAIAVPLLLTILTALMALGVAFNNELQLTYATSAGAQLLSISRGQTTNPCTTTSQAVYSAAPSLTQSNLKFTIVLGTHTVATSQAQPSCSGSQQYLVQTDSAQVTATYPCQINIFRFNPVPNCVLTAQTAVIIQ